MTANMFRLMLAASLALGLIAAALVVHESPWSWVLMAASLPWGVSLALALRAAGKGGTS